MPAEKGAIGALFYSAEMAQCTLFIAPYPYGGCAMTYSRYVV